MSLNENLKIPNMHILNKNETLHGFEDPNNSKYSDLLD